MGKFAARENNMLYGIKILIGVCDTVRCNSDFNVEWVLDQLCVYFYNKAPA